MLKLPKFVTPYNVVIVVTADNVKLLRHLAQVSEALRNSRDVLICPQGTEKSDADHGLVIISFKPVRAGSR